jgi:tetratricopeptide (TPR) repeat protein
MSLLLEALKKAERAKEEAQRRARGEAPSSPEPQAAQNESDGTPVLTRDKLPEISTTLEIASEDLSPAAAPAAAEPPRATLELAPEPAPANDQANARRSGAKAADEQAASRQAAKKVFEAKFREPNPRMPFYITMGALGIFAVGTIIYFWYQLRPPPSLVNLNPARQAEAIVAPAAESAPAASAVASTSIAKPSPIPGLPSAPANGPAPKPTSSAAAAAPAPARAETESPEAPAPRPAVRLAERAAPAVSSLAASEPRPTINRNPPQVHPQVAAAYSAYLNGDLAQARKDYEEALRDEPANRDALLGLAAIDVREGRYESAEALYLRLLQVDPRDMEAQAALIALRSGRADPLATETRVKTLLTVDPSAHALNFTLGNQLAAQNRWSEAQQQYFQAYAAEPDNPDFAYNLAVSLDHLRQRRQALEYYERALALAAKHGASFDAAAARARLNELAR